MLYNTNREKERDYGEVVYNKEVTFTLIQSLSH